MSHYPSTSELAAFRRSIPYAFDEGCNLDCDDWQHDFAWSTELRDGIGYRASITAYPPVAILAGQYCRREASAMRSRAYARQLDAATAEYARACALPPCGSTYQERQTAWTALYRLGVRSESAQGYRDFWDDQEPRQPLPVSYGKAFSIIN